MGLESCMVAPVRMARISAWYAHVEDVGVCVGGG
jgi:hypothetical protein